MPAAAAAATRTCLEHMWELGESYNPQRSKIEGVQIDQRYSVHCIPCDTRTTKLMSELCPRCFTTMEGKRVDTAVERFKKHPDQNLDKFHYATMHTCPTCSFKCVSFTWDK